MSSARRVHWGRSYELAVCGQPAEGELNTTFKQFAVVPQNRRCLRCKRRWLDRKEIIEKMEARPRE